jgi:siroheme synthase-like protein
MTLFPAFLKLENRPVLVVGGGVIATSKVPSLLNAGARITLVAPKLSCELAELVRNRQITWLPKSFEPADLNGIFLVIAATNIRDLNASVFAEAEKRNILCNAVDQIDHCHFYYGSVVPRGELQIAISTNGKSPVFAQCLRRELQEQFGPEYAALLDWLGAAGEVLRAQSADPETTRRFLHQLASKPMFERFLREFTKPASDQGAPITVLRRESTSLEGAPSFMRLSLQGWAHLSFHHNSSFLQAPHLPAPKTTLPPSPRAQGAL